MKPFFLVLIGVLAGCATLQPQTMTFIDAQDPPAPNGTCEASCAHVAAIGCPEGKDVASCVDVCSIGVGTVIGRVVDWTCADNAKTESDAQKCGVRFCGGT